MSDSVYTTGDVAKLVGVNFRTVIRWIERGELQGYKLPGRGDHRVTQDSLRAFMEKHQMPLPATWNEAESTPLSKSVLVVDDEAAMCQAIARVFKRDGWQVWTAQNGFQAGALLMEHKPSLMTLDLRMPGMDGFNVLSFTREHMPSETLKILVISAQPERDLKQAMVNGADAYLEKPFENSELLLVGASLITGTRSHKLS